MSAQIQPMVTGPTALLEQLWPGHGDLIAGVLTILAMVFFMALIARFLLSVEDFGVGAAAVGLVVAGVILLVGLAVSDSSNTSERYAAWAAYSAKACRVFERRIAAGEEGQTTIGVAALPTSSGPSLAPAVGFSSGTPDRVLTGWTCDNGKSYVSEEGRAPRDFEVSEQAATSGAAAGPKD